MKEKKEIEMTENNEKMEQTPEETLPVNETLEELAPEETIPDDGQTETAPALEALETPSETLQDSLAINASLGDFYTQDEFYAGFKGCFEFAGERTGLKSLPIKENQELGARKTSDKLYEMAVKYPVFHFLIDKKSGWLYDASLIALFVYSKTDEVLQEKKQVGLKGWFKGKWQQWRQKKANA